MDGRSVATIHSNLTDAADVTGAKALATNQRIAFSGTKKSGEFDIPDACAIEWLHSPNPHGKPNSDILKPWLNGSAIVKRMPFVWIIDTGTELKSEELSLYEGPHAHVLQHVKPQRDENKREHRRLNWWLHAETCPGMRAGVSGLNRFLSTPRVSKFRIFSWADSIVLPDDGIYIFARSDDYFFGILHSRYHEIWSLKLGSRLEDRPRYTPNTCFETFAFPFADDFTRSDEDPAQIVAKFRAAHYHTDQDKVLREEAPPRAPGEHRTAIAAAAADLNKLRERWLNPPEWTQTRTLSFPGSAEGPWARYVVPQSIDPHTGIGTVCYPRLEARDADCAAMLKKRTFTNLYNERPTWLALAHERLDAAVAAAYGWPADLTGNQILERLLELNLARAAEEEKNATAKQPKLSRGKQDGELL